jgi:hypothetical protein
MPTLWSAVTFVQGNHAIRKQFYLIAEKIAKHGKPFVHKEFIKVSSVHC